MAEEKINSVYGALSPRHRAFVDAVAAGQYLFLAYFKHVYEGQKEAYREDEAFNGYLRMAASRLITRARMPTDSS